MEQAYAAACQALGEAKVAEVLLTQLLVTRDGELATMREGYEEKSTYYEAALKDLATLQDELKTLRAENELN
jgi:hypothetical protein